MNVVVPVKLVPDLVEELEIAPSGVALDTTFGCLVLNEFDEHALEQALLLKERSGATVTVLAAGPEAAEEVLYSAAAKGADRLVRIGADLPRPANSHALARLFGAAIREMAPDLVLIGVQAHDSLDGPIGPMLAEGLGMPYVGYVSGVTLADGCCTVRKEYPGGMTAEVEVDLPAVLGIQAAEQPPRYVAISKVRQAMKEATIEQQTAAEPDASGAAAVSRMYKPETGQRAIMIEGDIEAVASGLVDIFREQGLL